MNFVIIGEFSKSLSGNTGILSSDFLNDAESFFEVDFFLDCCVLDVFLAFKEID